MSLWAAAWALVFPASAQGSGYRAREAASLTRVVEVPRIASGSLDGEALLTQFVLADVPVVVQGSSVLFAASPRTMRHQARWAPRRSIASEPKPSGNPARSCVAFVGKRKVVATGGAPAWFEEEVLAQLDGRPVLSYGNESTRRRQTLSWGCRRTAKQCAVAWWYSGSAPASYVARGAPSQGGPWCDGQR